MRRSFAFKCTVLVMLWVLVAIACAQVPAYTFWPATFGALTLPVALALNLGAVLYWLLRRWTVALLPLALAVLTWPHFQRGLAVHPLRVAPASGAVGPQVKVLSANVRIFNVYPQLRDADLGSSRRMVQWVAENPADILCLQEFYNEPAGARTRDGDVFRTVDKIGRQSRRQAFVSKTLTNSIGAEFGLAIFSRFPMVGRGTVHFGQLTQNHAMWADLRLPQGDTIRVYNFHLQSMSLEEQDIVDSYSSRSGFRQKGLSLLRRFKRGAAARHWQVDTLVRRFERCRYPILLCADLNDLPYSYSYDQLADRFQNGWATVGNGVGRTYNGRLPFVRIDNQFASPHFTVDDFWVHYEIPYSDHFPTTATYRLNSKPTGPQ
ncbi:endonuclease/exonuclease/phosphatase family protein [Hymenobacter weizhouensis]|uniref:endonuclease/exonuclease/phosphatase family protein n=1 Tax=Hymenobacter sp. YIM 151500-1 TaxID=2987689 RepID=UPI002225BF75|nr:endonuclease/exonuclease/phosphatase family protein [Hymenobacter sp. YIM 151500-1]UYZ62758.1 endonuclease/exonuclease/phosphatase family protein [Hymenobacter sp. YIM 151500-1]